MTGFEAEYARLNDQQRRAVDAIDGPVLVMAGPGTGKTQLLSVRVANIMRLTDTAPANILCLTYTDNAARNMRERLETIIGQAAYHVTIQTFHSFGADIINRYSDYFTGRQFLQQVGELGRYELAREIFETLAHRNPLSTRLGDDFVHLKDTLEVISWLKQNALAPDELRHIIAANQSCIEVASDLLGEVFAATPSPKHLTDYQRLLKLLATQAKGQAALYGFPAYALGCANDLADAVAATAPDGRYAPAITAWRNKWCLKDGHGRHIFKDARGNLKLRAVAEVYEQLVAKMAARGLYDFDDMIVEVVRAMETNDELRFSLQERYQYILVDEFQDTNKAQLRLLNALGDNPLLEGRPNIMAVGDDDQAIYAFQGAEVSNMVAFATQYRQPALISLEDNYRSSADILTAGFGVAEQITDRLTALLPDVHKRLVAQKNYDKAALQHNVFPSELAQYDWVAEQISKYLEQGMKPEDIAVIAPRHRYLERLMPYLGQRRIPVAYERRENILDSPLIIQLLTMAELICAIAEQRLGDVDRLLSEVLGYDFWQLPDDTLLQLSLDCYQQHEHWLPVAAKHENPQIEAITLWFMALAKRSRLEPLEYVLDQLVGGLGDGQDNEFDDLMLPVRRTAKNFVSPLREYNFSPERYEQHTDAYLALLGQLSTLRQQLREWRPADTLYVKDLVQFANLHRAAGIKIIDTNPHTQTTNAVQVMTAYKAKGLEFGVVFVINAQDEVWGPTARSRHSTISLPANLPLAPASDGDNDRLRLLFVALTRAKHDLIVTGYSHTLANKLSPGLSFLSELDAFVPQSIDKPTTPEAESILSTDWAYRFRQVIADKPTLFEPILANYKLSVTHLNNFIDVAGSGPEYFMLHNLLRFPEAPTPSAAYGDAVHKTLQWAQGELRVNGSLPTTKQIVEYFNDVLARKHLRHTDAVRLQDRGQTALEDYFRQKAQELQPSDLAERGFNNEGVVVMGARLSGKIDKIHFDEPGRVTVVDYKTGKPSSSWQGRDYFEKLKLHKYRQQLLFYKLLIEHSASYAGKLEVTAGALEFVEPDESGQLLDPLALTFDAAELNRFTKLIAAVWQHIIQLDFPDVSAYETNARGVAQFEQDLIDGKI